MKKLSFLLFLLVAFCMPDAFSQTCGTPTGLNATPIYDFQTTINWTAVSGAQFYNIKYRKVGAPTFSTTTSTPNVKILSGLTPGTQYEYQVQTKCASGLSAYTSSAFFTTTATCDVPYSLSVTHTFPYNFKSTINWAPVTQALYFTFRYRLKVGPGPWISGTTSGNSKQINTLQGTWYEYQVATNCPGGQSAYSPLDSFLTPCLYVSANNAVGTSSRTQTQVEGDTIIYSDSVGCKFLAAIEDTMGGNALGVTTVTQTVTSSVVTGVDPNYTLVRRKTTVSPGSNGHGRLLLAFSQEDFTNYNANNSTFLDLPNFGDSNHIWIPRIKILKVVGATKTYLTPDSMRWNAPSNTWLVFMSNLSQIAGDYYAYTMPDCIGINVSGLNVTNVLGTSFRANWTPLTSPWFGWYSLRYKPVSSGTWEDGGTSAYNTSTKLLIGLTPNTAYEVQVRFHCSSLSEGDWSSSVNFTTTNTCLTPGTSSISNITASSAKVTWPSSTGALFYTVRYRTSAGPGAWVTGTSSSANKNLTGLSAATQYDVQVGTNCAGWLSTYNSITQFTTAASRPGSPAIAETEAVQGIELSPNPANNFLNISFNDDAASGYELRVVDMNGKIVLEAHVQSVQGSNSHGLDISSLNRGMYTLTMVGVTKPVYHSKFIKD